MKTEHLYTIISVAIVVGLFYLFYRVISPFLITIAWAMVLSITFYPLYKLLLRWLRYPWLASLVTLMIILILIIGPFTYIVTALVNEITDIYSVIEERGFKAITRIQEHPWLSDLLNRISTSIPAVQNIDLNEAAVKSLKALGSYIGQHISGFFKNIVVFTLSFIVMCLTIFYFLKDGEALTSYIMRILPFSEDQKIRLEERVKEMVIAAVYGGIVVGIVQGLLGGLAFFVLGISSPVFWGSAMAVMSLVPFFGAFSIWGPAVVILIMAGNYAKGIGLFFFGMFVISMVDNILKPLIIGGRTRLHTLLIFFSVLGGIKFLGFVGFILGPLIAAMCLSLLEIYTVRET